MSLRPLLLLTLLLPALAAEGAERPAKPGSPAPAGDPTPSCGGALPEMPACLDLGYDSSSGLSQYVVEAEPGVRHFRRGGSCGVDGHYRLMRGSGLLLDTPEIPRPSLYRVQVLYRGTRRPRVLHMEAGGSHFVLEPGNDDPRRAWQWTRPVELPLGAGVTQIRLSAANRAPVDVEAVNVERVFCDDTPPEIVASLAPPANANGWHRDDVTVSFECSDPESGIASCTDPVLVASEGAGQEVEGTALNNAGYTATTTALVNLDRISPTVSIDDPTDGDTVTSSPLTVSGSVGDALSGVDTVECNGVPGVVAAGTFSCDVDLDPGIQVVTVEARDLAGNVASDSISVDHVETLVWPNEQSPANSDPWLPAHHAQIRLLQPRLMVLNFVNNRTMPQMLNHVNAAIAAIREGSRHHGYEDAAAPIFLDYQLAYPIDMRDASTPPGYPYRNSTLYPREDPVDGFWSLDYELLFTQEYAAHYGIEDPDAPGELLTLGELFERGLVHEVWLYGDPSVPDVNGAEILELKPKYDENRQRIPGEMSRCAGNGCFDEEDDIPVNRTVRIAFMDSTRGLGCLLHSLSHGFEAIGAWRPDIVPYLHDYFPNFSNQDLNTRYGLQVPSWYSCSAPDCLSYPTTTSVNYDLFFGTGTIAPYDPVCGNTHFPPNARRHYDDVSPATVLSSCTHFRDGTGDVAPFTTAVFQQYQTVAPDCGGAFLVWWWQNMPNLDNQALDDDGQPMLSWLPFIFY